MSNRAQGKTLAILASDGFEEVELTAPRDAVAAEGGKTMIIADKEGTIEANQHREKGQVIKVDLPIDHAKADDFDALLIPGGLFSPDTLRVNDAALAFVRAFFEQKKPVFAICHGPQLLISAEVVKDRKVTAIAPIRIDLRNAGAHVVDEEVVVDQGLVTSRTPEDLEAFCDKVIEELCEGEHEEQQRSLASHG